MGDRNVIQNKLNQLDKYLQVLRKYEEIERNKLEEDIDTLLTVERALQLSLQIVLDIGNHVLADRGVAVDDYGEIFPELSRAEIIPEDFAKKIEGMAGLRNILVHDYAEVDLEILLKVLHEGLDDLEEIATYYKDYSEKDIYRDK